MKKLTTKEFVERSILRHNNFYNYSKSEYKGKNEKVCIICPIHGEFGQIAGNHMSGQGCPKCGIERTSKSKNLSTEAFIEKAKWRHKDKYIYDKTVYTGCHSDVIVTCPTHGDFYVNAHQHISNLTGCPICANVNKGPTKLTTAEFVEKAKLVHGNKYDYSNVNYITSTEKVEIICPDHGSFGMTPNKHLCGQNCPLCTESQGEQFITSILIDNLYTFDRQYILPVESDIRKYLRIDFLIKNGNSFYFIEYHGIQHYQSVDYFGGFTKFIEQQSRDNLLRQIVNNNKDYHLLEVDYRGNRNIIKNKILDFLKSVPINSDINSKSGELLETLKTDNQQPS